MKILSLSLSFSERVLNNLIERARRILLLEIVTKTVRISSDISSHHSDRITPSRRGFLLQFRFIRSLPAFIVAELFIARVLLITGGHARPLEFLYLVSLDLMYSCVCTIIPLSPRRNWIAIYTEISPASSRSALHFNFSRDDEFSRVNAGNSSSCSSGTNRSRQRLSF